MVWLLHFHKAAGTSFSELALLNGLRGIPGQKGKHSHLELIRTTGQRELDWTMIIAGRGGLSPPQSCSSAFRSQVEKVGGHTLHSWPRLLEDRVKRVRSAGTSFVSTEHWFPALAAPAVEFSHLRQNVVLVTLLREPIERLWSSYNLHGHAGRRCSQNSSTDATCSLEEWATAEANIYSRLLVGEPVAPMLVTHACTQAYAKRGLSARAVQQARQALQKIDLVLTLDTFISRPADSACALKKKLGWAHGYLPKPKATSSANKSDSAKLLPEMEQQLRVLNAADLQLYMDAKALVKRHLEALGCEVQPLRSLAARVPAFRALAATAGLDRPTAAQPIAARPTEYECEMADGRWRLHTSDEEYDEPLRLKSRPRGKEMVVPAEPAISVVIPTFGRPRSLNVTLTHLLGLNVLHRNGSEIIVGHGRSESFTWATNGSCRICQNRRVRHLDMAQLEASTGVRVASRFFAALSARNDVLLHLDDDKLPTSELVTELAEMVAREPGFPDYPTWQAAPGLYGPKSTMRLCGAHGVSRLPPEDFTVSGLVTEVAISLTSVAATSAALNRRYVRAFPAYQPLLNASAGNGEDLTYAHFVASLSYPMRGFGHASSPLCVGIKAHHEKNGQLSSVCRQYGRGRANKHSNPCKEEFVDVPRLDNRTGEYSRAKGNANCVGCALEWARFHAFRDGTCVALFQMSSPYSPENFQNVVRGALSQGGSALATVGYRISDRVASVSAALLHTFAVGRYERCGCERQRFYVERFGIVFTHVPKAAGTSLESLLLGETPGLSGSHSCHATIRQMERCIRPQANTSTPRFWVWRHPLSRLVSMYEYARAGGNGNESTYSWAEGMSFDLFVRWLEQARSALMGSLPGIFSPQALWSSPPYAGQMHTLHMHSLDEDWSRLRELFPRLPQQPLDKHRVTRHAPWCTYYSNASTLSLARQLYAEDFGLVSPKRLRQAEAFDCGPRTSSADE